MKKFVSILLALTLVSACLITANASSKKAEVYSVYSDNMLFKQNEDAVIAGTATSGNEIKAELLLGNTVIANGKTTAKSDGTFAVSFKSPVGSYTQYTVILKENGAEFKKLENVVFGELWLAGGQSNMMYPLGQAEHGLEMMQNGQKLSPWIRVLTTPAYPEYKGSTELVPLEPLNDIKDAKWISGEDSGIYGTSAVGYFFAKKLMEEIDMPVGILNLNLGGSAIASWLSRDAIDSDTAVKKHLTENDRYFPAEKWKEDGHNIYVDMTVNYNLRIHPARNFRISGMIWYQGESDIGNSAEEYSDSIDLLQRSYTEVFGYQNGLLPFIFTQLASYFYSEDGLCLPQRNIDFSNIQQERPESRALVSIYDLPLTFLPEAGSIHPETKKEIGERMAYAAKGFIYGKSDCYTTATVEKTEIKDGSIYVTFRNVGDGLKFGSNLPTGFAVCGSDGIFARADAEIISENTIKIYSDYVENPVSASYAYSVMNMKSNLYATENGVLTLPVSPFVTNQNNIKQYWIDKIWADCESETSWHIQGEEFSKYHPLWESNNANISFSAEDAFSGEKGMKIRSESNSFSINPLLTYKDGIEAKVFSDVDANYTNYGTITVNIRNNGENDVNLNEIRFYKSSSLWYTPAFSDTSDTSAFIPADGKWHTLTFDLNKLYLYGNECGISSPNERLKKVKNIEFIFESDGNSDISIDAVRFSPTAENPGPGFDAETKNADNPLEFLSALIVGFIGMIVSIFE